MIIYWFGELNWQMKEKKVDLVLTHFCNQEVDSKVESDMLQHMVEAHACQFQMRKLSLNYLFSGFVEFIRIDED